MRKVTTINLNNNAYQIDEEGYEALRAYLDRAARALGTNPDREEILADLEQAIADKCVLTLGPHKTVVGTAEIERILQEMGPVAGGAEGAGTDSSESTGASADAAPAGANAYRPRRLYRVTEGGCWAGICQGLAAFAGIDVTLVRVAVVLITIFTGFFPGLLVYFVMCFIVPVASTPEEIAAAHGQPFRAQEVVDRVKKKHDDWRSERSERREKRRMKHSWWSPPAATQPAPGAAARVTGGVLLPVLTVISALWFAVMATGAYLLWHNWYQADFQFGPREMWHLHSEAPRWIALIAIIALYAVIAIPIGAGRRASLYYANGGRLHGWADAWSGLLWIGLVALLLLGAWFVMPDLMDLLRHEIHQSGRAISV